MPRARFNPIGALAPEDLTLVRVGSGQHTHILDPNTGYHLCRSGMHGDFKPSLYLSDSKHVTCYRCLKLLELNRD